MNTFSVPQDLVHLHTHHTLDMLSELIEAAKDSGYQSKTFTLPLGKEYLKEVVVPIIENAGYYVDHNSIVQPSDYESYIYISWEDDSEMYG